MKFDIILEKLTKDLKNGDVDFGFDYEDDSDAYSKGGYDKAAKDIDKYVKGVEEKEYNQHRQPTYRAMITRGLNMPHFTVEMVGEKSEPMIKYSNVFTVDDLSTIQTVCKKLLNKSAGEIFTLVDEPWCSLVIEGCVAGLYYGMVKEKITNTNVLYKLAHDGGAKVLEGLEIEGEHKALTNLCALLDIPWAYDKDLTTVNALASTYDCIIMFIGEELGQ